MAENKPKEKPPKENLKRRSYKPETGESVTIEPGESVEGVFQGTKEIQITDQNTKEKKDVTVYRFRKDNGDRFVILGRTMLDQAFDDMYEKEGGYDRCVGLHVKIDRGPDEKLPGRRSMGTYELTVWEE